MAIKETSVISVGYPILATKFINNKTILVIGGGGEGNNGVPNKITAIKCSFKVTDKSRILQRFREITLPSNEDSPQCVDIIRTVEADEKAYGVFVGCNQSSQLMLSMGINNNLRKYSFTQEEHLRFLDAAQMEPATHGIDDFPKIVRLSPRGTVGCLMTSTVPSSIYIFNPDSLDLFHKFKPIPDQEIKDFVLDPSDDGEGNVLAYITSKSIQTILTKTGQPIFFSDKTKSKSQLEKYALSKVRYTQSGQELIIAGTNRKDKSAVIILYSLKLGKIIKVSTVSKKFGVIGALDISTPANLIAVAGNNLSVVLLRLSDLKVIQTFEQLHPFAITDVAFSPNGHKLASVSAAQTLYVMKIPPKYAKGRSTIGSIFRYLFMIIFMALLAIFVQAAFESGEFDELIALSKEYGSEWGKLSKEFSMEKSKVWWDHSKQWSEVGLEYANDYGHKGWELAQIYGKVGFEYSKKGLALADVYAHRGIEIVKEKLKKDKVSDNDEDTDYFKVDDWDAKTHELKGEDDTYMTPGTETPSSKEIEEQGDYRHETSFADHVRVKTETKNIDEYTKDNQNVDTESLLNNADIYETKIVAASSIVSQSSVETVESSSETPEASSAVDLSVESISELTSLADISQTLSALSSAVEELKEEVYPNIDEPINVDTKADEGIEEFKNESVTEEQEDLEQTAVPVIEEVEISSQSSEPQEQIPVPGEAAATPIEEAEEIKVEASIEDVVEPPIGEVVEPPVEEEVEQPVEEIVDTPVPEVVDTPVEVAAENVDQIPADIADQIPEEIAQKLRAEIEQRAQQSAESNAESSPFPVESDPLPTEETAQESAAPSSVKEDAVPVAAEHEQRYSSVDEPEPYVYQEDADSRSVETVETTIESTSESETSVVPIESHINSEEEKQREEEEEDYRKEQTPSFPPPQQQVQSSVVEEAASIPPVSSEEKPTLSYEYDTLTVVETIRETETNDDGQRQVIHKVITKIRKYQKPVETPQVVHDEL